MGTVIASNRHHNYNVVVKLIVWECPACGIVYGIPQEFADRCRDNGDTYYCPNGHSLGWSEDEATRQRKRAVAAERRATNAEAAAAFQREQAETERRRTRAYKGQITSMRRRIAAGVCPVPGCKRTGFVNVMRHVAAKHPAWHHDHAAEVTL